jgi:deoxyadenosine/deoxycytidine kinase
MEKTIIILRSVSGAGKSSFAEFLKNLSMYGHFDTEICCADDFFTDENGNYNFDATKLHLAHTECQEKFERAIALTNHDVRLVIVANTNTKEKDVNHYKKLVEEAKEHWSYQNKKPNVTYKVFVLTVENWHQG